MIKRVGVGVAVAWYFSVVIAIASAVLMARGDSIPLNSLAILFGVLLAGTAVAVWRGNSGAAWRMVVLGVVGAPMYLTSIGGVVLVVASLVAALQLHLRQQSRSAALLMDWWVGWRVMVGAAIPERLDLIAIAVVVAIAWLIGLVVAEAGPLMAMGLFLYLGLGAAEIALIVYLAVRLIRRVRGKR